MSKWEYLCMGHWLPVPEEYNKKLDKRYERPSLDSIRLKTPLGTIRGVPETRNMEFKIYGESDGNRSTIRRGPKVNELPLIEIKDGDYPRILSDSTRHALFNDDGTPKTTRLEHDDSSEKFMCQEGRIYQEVDGVFVSRNHGNADITSLQFEDITKTQYIWQFKGPFRWERMRSAVHKTCSSFPAEKSTKLRHLFSNFDPKEDATEYGPYQFEDYLAQHGELEMSISVMENFHSQSESNWTSFDAMTNARIESARNSGKPMTIVKVKGHTYMLLFDSGSGASGAGPVIIRPMRYQKILESIEEQFDEENNVSASEDQRRSIMSELFDTLVEHGHNPSVFLMSTLHQPNPYATLSPALRPVIEGIFNRLQNISQVDRGGLSTRIQQFMPALLEKFKECDVRLAPNQVCRPKKLSLKISRTLKNGLSVPKTFKCDWNDMIRFIAKEQCWVHSGADSTCDICMERVPTLKHCGSSSACLKCWTQTAIETNFSCPFCRQDIEPGQLKLQAPDKPNNKRKRDSGSCCTTTKLSIDSILDKIREDDLYKDIRPETSFAMKKWFVILLRRGLINIHQRPEHGKSAKTLEDAAKIFKLV